MNKLCSFCKYNMWKGQKKRQQCKVSFNYKWDVCYVHNRQFTFWLGDLKFYSDIDVVFIPKIAKKIKLVFKQDTHIKEAQYKQVFNWILLALHNIRSNLYLNMPFFELGYFKQR